MTGALVGSHLAIAAALAGSVWLVQLRTRNAGLIDAAWPLMIAAGAVLYAVRGTGDETARVVLCSLAAVWSLRLGAFLLLRNAGHAEERRYAELRAKWGAAANRWMLLFFMLQAVLAWIIAFSFLPIAFRDTAVPAYWLFAALVFGVAGIVGEAVADAQLQKFKRDPLMRGKVMDRGLWRYSRHPNYFFECIFWLAFPCLAAGAATGWLGALGVVIISLLLLKFSGIPTVEARAAAARRAGYDRYVQRTSAFVPLPPRR